MSFLVGMSTRSSSILSKVVSSSSVKFHAQQQRSFWGWLNSIFNKYDESRVKEVGPDRACAEWLIRCGAAVKWSHDSEWFKDYNALPSLDQSRHLTIHEIDGTDSAVMHMGFPFLRGLKDCQKIVLHRAHYVDDDALIQLAYVKNCLMHLQVSACGNVTDKGLLSLGQLKKLETLLLYDLPSIRDRQFCIETLTRVLPFCKINFPYAQASEQKKDT